MRLELASASAGETERIAADLAVRLVPGDVVTVSGELGAGKTTFVRGACRALGVTAPVTSPTFTIGHRYSGRVDVSHLDLYRFTGLSAAEYCTFETCFCAGCTTTSRCMTYRTKSSAMASVICVNMS